MARTTSQIPVLRMRLSYALLKVAAYAGGPTIVAGAERVQLASAADADELVQRATACRAVESTAMNAVSSRSHSVFMLYISGTHAASSTRVLGTLNLVDLAGRWALPPLHPCPRPCCQQMWLACDASIVGEHWSLPATCHSNRAWNEIAWA